MAKNLNYQAGRRLEYGRKKHWAKRGFEVIRTAGSHGSYDLIGLRSNEVPLLVQCKRTASLSEAKRLLSRFKSDPPLVPSLKYRQLMEVQVKGSSEIHSEEV